MLKSIFREAATRLKHFIPWLSHEERFRFYKVEAGKLYRSSQPMPEALSYFVEKYGINSIIILLKHAKDWEFDWASAHKLAVLQIPISGRAPSDDEINKFIEFVSRKSNHPVLVHCVHGRDRTGCLCFVYRVEVMGWDAKDAWREMKKLGYCSLPWHFWTQTEINITRWLEGKYKVQLK